MASIQGVYIALFGRPADPAGLAYFNAETNNGADLTAIGDLAQTQEYKDRFAGQNNVQIVTAIYQSLFNRDPEAAGLNFFVNALNNGTLNINNVAIAILDGAQGNDLVVVNAKIESANLFTAAIDTPIEVGSYVGDDAAAAGRAFLAPITTTPATQEEAEAAVQGVVDGGNLGNTVALTAAGTDVVTPGELGSTTATSNRDDTINATTAGDLDASDEIDGGFGVDTLNVTLAAGPLVILDGSTTGYLRNVEILNISSAAGSSIDLTEAVGVQQAWIEDSAGAVGVGGLDVSTTIGLRGSVAAGAQFTFLDVGGSSDAATLALDTATAAGVTINGIEKLTISATGDNDVTITNATELETVTVSGSGNVTIDLSTVVDLVSYTGGTGADVVTVDATALLENATINTGAGNDILTVDVSSALGAAITLTGGAGSDLFDLGTLSNINDDGAAVTAATLADSLVTISDFNAAQDVIDLDLTGAATVFNNVQLSNIQGASTLLAALTLAESYGAITGNATFVYKGDTYVFQNDGVAGLQAGDGLVKITGLTDLDLLTAANFI